MSDTYILKLNFYSKTDVMLDLKEAHHLMLVH